MITSSVIACIRGASANGLPTAQRSISRWSGDVDHLHVTLDRLAVEGGQEELALAHVARADRGQDRVGPDNRPQRRLAGERGCLLGLGGEERAHVVGVARDHSDVPAADRAAEPEDLPDLAPGAEDELDLAQAEAQRLQPGRQRQRSWEHDLGVRARGAGRRGRRLAEQFRPSLRDGRRCDGLGAHLRSSGQ
jgi:hypothetical protein